MASTDPKPSYKILATPPLRRSFPLPTSPLLYFTGDVFDRLVLFLHKHHVTFTSIECVARGVDKASALRNGPTICVYVVQDAGLTRRLLGQRREIGEGVVKKEEEVHDGNEKGDGGPNARKTKREYEKKQLGEVGETNEKHVEGRQQTEKQQPEDDNAGDYVKEIARLFRECQFALEVPHEIRFIEFVGVILHEDPSRVIGTSETWANGGVMGVLAGS